MSIDSRQLQQIAATLPHNKTQEKILARLYSSDADPQSIMPDQKWAAVLTAPDVEAWMREAPIVAHAMILWRIGKHPHGRELNSNSSSMEKHILKDICPTRLQLAMDGALGGLKRGAQLSAPLMADAVRTAFKK